MTDQEEAPSQEEVRAGVIASQAEGTLLAAERALDLAISVFEALIADARGGDVSEEAEIRKAAGRLTGLQQTLLKEKAKYELESGKATGGANARSIDFGQVRTEIGRALDRIRTDKGTDGVSGQPD